MSFKNFWICFLITLHKCHVSINLVVPESAHVIAQLILYLSDETKSWLKQGGNTFFPADTSRAHLPSMIISSLCTLKAEEHRLGLVITFPRATDRAPSVHRVTLPTFSGIWMLLISYSPKCENPGCSVGSCPLNWHSYVLGSYLHIDLRQYTFVPMHKSWVDTVLIWLFSICSYIIVRQWQKDFIQTALQCLKKVKLTSGPNT